MLRLSLLFISAAVSVLLIGCKKELDMERLPVAEIPVTGVTLNSSGISMYVGDVNTIIATVSPSKATNKLVLWTSANSSIAIVSGNGEVAAVAPGSTEITAKTDDGGYTAVCKIHVLSGEESANKVTSITLNKKHVELFVGESTTLVAEVLPENADDPTVQWKSSDEEIAAVKDGYVTALSKGEVEIIAESVDGGVSDTCLVVVNEPEIPTEIKDLNGNGEAANCYIVSESGTYKFCAVKGNSMIYVRSVAKVETLWESFGTDIKPETGALIKEVWYEDGTVFFMTPDTFCKGNAVIAAKDSSGEILWSWHIWLTDEPSEHIYKNGAGIMMDRNLGATTAVPGDVRALGLLYQWGRKDPFLGSSDIDTEKKTESSKSWPRAVTSSATTGTISYSQEHPMTLILRNTNNYDWYYSTTERTDNQRWNSQKTMYDPCPSGWRVPDGGKRGIWKLSNIDDTEPDSQNKGIAFEIDNNKTTWYPFAGSISDIDGDLMTVGSATRWWSVTVDEYYANCLHVNGRGSVDSENRNNRAAVNSVRCYKIGSTSSESETPEEPEMPTHGRIIDLGLSVDWAGWNIGASKPEGYGAYYAWGEVSVKRDYSLETYKYYDWYLESYDYIGTEISGTKYDAASASWGDEWRMPTKNEVEELINECEWIRDEYNGVYGYYVIGPNGNSIFLPFAGYYDGKDNYDEGHYGRYWVGQINNSQNDGAYFLSMASDYSKREVINWYRYHGFTIRAVMDK